MVVPESKATSIEQATARVYHLDAALQRLADAAQEVHDAYGRRDPGPDRVKVAEAISEASQKVAVLMSQVAGELSEVAGDFSQGK